MLKVVCLRMLIYAILYTRDIANMKSANVVPVRRFLWSRVKSNSKLLYTIIRQSLTSVLHHNLVQLCLYQQLSCIFPIRNAAASDCYFCELNRSNDNTQYKLLTRVVHASIYIYISVGLGKDNTLRHRHTSPLQFCNTNIILYLYLEVRYALILQFNVKNITCYLFNVYLFKT